MRVKRMSSTTNAEFSIGGFPSPMMSRAPSYIVAGLPWLSTFENQVHARMMQATTNAARRITLLEERRRVALRHEADRNQRDFLHRLDVNRRDVVGHRIGNIGCL